MLIFTCQATAQGAAEASSNQASRREPAPEQLPAESYASCPEDWPASATA